MLDNTSLAGTTLERSHDDAERLAAELVADLQQRWNGSLLTLDGPNRAVKAAASLAPRVADAVWPLLDEIEPSKRAAVREHARAVVGALLPSTELIVGADEEGVADLAAMAVQSCVEPDYFEDMEIRVGYGGAPLDSPNVRTAAYIVAPKQILTRLARLRAHAETFAALDRLPKEFPAAKTAKLRGAVYGGATLSDQQTDLLAAVERSVEAAGPNVRQPADVPFPRALPRVVVYSAHEFLAQINGDGPQLRACAQETLRFLEAYVAETCPPEIAARFRFDDDLPVAGDPVLARQLDYWADAVAANSDPAAIEAREKIARLGAKHAGDEHLGLQYAVAHAAYSADAVDVPGVPILRQSPALPAGVVMIGGPPEKLFWKVRQVVRQSVSARDGVTHLRQQSLTADTEETRSAAQRLLAAYESYEPPATPARRAQLISRVGEIPVYSGELAGREPSLRDAAREGFDPEAALAIDGVRTSVREDLVVLFQDLLGREPQSVRAVAKGKQPLASPERMAEVAARLRRIANS